MTPEIYLCGTLVQGDTTDEIVLTSDLVALAEGAVLTFRRRSTDAVAYEFSEIAGLTLDDEAGTVTIEPFVWDALPGDYYGDLALLLPTTGEEDLKIKTVFRLQITVVRGTNR